MKKKIAIIRGKFLADYDIASFEVLSGKYDFTAFGSKTSTKTEFKFPTVRLFSPMDIPNFPYKIPILNRLFVDAHYLIGLESSLKGFDIAHCAETYFHFTRQALNAKRKGNVKKVIITVLENIPFNNEGIWGRKKFKKRTLSEADYFIAATFDAKLALIKEGADEEKISVIGLSVDTSMFFPDKNYISKQKTSKDINILFVGRIEKFKGVFDVVASFNQVVKKFPDKKISLTLVGKGSEENQLLNKIREYGLDNKVLLKNVKYGNIPDQYRKADIFVGPSKEDKYWKEQFGMVFAEAMASGLPVITSASGSIKEVVGKDAFLVKPGNVGEIIKCLSDLIENSAKRIEYSKKSRKRAEKYLSNKVAADKLDVVYKKLL